MKIHNKVLFGVSSGVCWTGAYTLCPLKSLLTKISLDKQHKESSFKFSELYSHAVAYHISVKEAQSKIPIQSLSTAALGLFSDCLSAGTLHIFWEQICKHGTEKLATVDTRLNLTFHLTFPLTFLSSAGKNYFHVS